MNWVSDEFCCVIVELCYVVFILFFCVYNLVFLIDILIALKFEMPDLYLINF